MLDVIAGTPADKAGLEVGDELFSVGNNLSNTSLLWLKLFTKSIL